MTDLQLPACAVGDWTSYVFPLVPLKRQAPEEDTPVRGEVASLPQPRGFALILGRGVSLQPEGAAEGGGGCPWGVLRIDDPNPNRNQGWDVSNTPHMSQHPLLSHNPGIESPPPPTNATPLMPSEHSYQS